MKFEIKNRWTFKVQFTAEIECSEDAPLSLKRGLALKWAIKEGVSLKYSDFEGADLKYSDFEGADLEGSDLKYANLEGASFEGANLKGADLEGSDLKYANLEGASFEGANLENANLECADLRGANLKGVILRGSDIPTIENIHQKVFAAASSENALDMDNWHKCATTHCRAGWVVHLAGDRGYALERAFRSTPLAAALIYQKSDPGLEKVPDFYTTDAIALKDMKRLAALKQGEK